MRVSDFDYYLPKGLIAQSPPEKRDSSRLLILDKKTGDISHGVFGDILNGLTPPDCLVINNTKVIPARLIGRKPDTGATVELLLLKQNGDVWECLARPGRKLREGTVVEFGNGILRGRIVAETKDGGRLVAFEYDGIFNEILDMLGQMPLPPYITQRLNDPARYNTIYAKYDGAAAAPTAGLHFTEGLLLAIKKRGVAIAQITLHVGLGTFRPVKAENVEDHHMHSESFEISGDAAATINNARAHGGRIVACGTTVCRTLESAADNEGLISPQKGETSIFIYPGYRFKATDALITNFHLPKSTLMMLVSAFAGRENIMSAYEMAISKGYRFFSFGDAMYIK